MRQPGVVGVLLHRRGDLLHTRRGLLKRGGGRFGALRQIDVARRQLAAPGVDLRAGVTHAHHRLRERQTHRFDGAYQTPQLVIAGRGQRTGQIACRHMLQLLHRLRERFEQQVPKRQPDQRHHRRGQQRHQTNQRQHHLFLRQHAINFLTSTRLAPALKRLHIVIKRAGQRDKPVAEQIVVIIRALLVERRHHRREPLAIQRVKTLVKLAEQQRALFVIHLAGEHRFQQLLTAHQFARDDFHGRGRVVHHADFHLAHRLACLVARTQQQRIAFVQTHHFFALQRVNAL